MDHLVAGVVKRWCENAEGPPSTPRRTSRDSHTELMTKSGPGLRKVEIGWDDMRLPGVEDLHNYVYP